MRNFKMTVVCSCLRGFKKFSKRHQLSYSKKRRARDLQRGKAPALSLLPLTCIDSVEPGYHALCFKVSIFQREAAPAALIFTLMWNLRKYKKKSYLKKLANQLPFWNQITFTCINEFNLPNERRQREFLENNYNFEAKRMRTQHHVINTRQRWFLALIFA